jgi:HEAT repeat protein
MKPGIPHIIEMLKDSDRWVRNSAAGLFRKLADHRKKSLREFPQSDILSQLSSMTP